MLIVASFSYCPYRIQSGANIHELATSDPVPQSFRDAQCTLLSVHLSCHSSDRVFYGVYAQVADHDVSSTSVLVNLFWATMRCLQDVLSQEWTEAAAAIVDQLNGALFGDTGLAYAIEAMEQYGTGRTLPFYGLGRVGGTLSHLRRNGVRATAVATPDDNTTRVSSSADAALAAISV